MSKIYLDKKGLFQNRLDIDKDNKPINYTRSDNIDKWNSSV